MNRYSIELHYIEEDLGYNLFNENFPFYEPALREQFVKKFYDKYRFREIGTETIYRFKVMLNSRINLIMPYYTQLYQTELAAKKINFLLNKDLKETFIREITGQNNVESTSTTNTTGENNVESTSTSAKTGENNVENTTTSNTSGENSVESTSTTNTNGESNSTSEGRFLDTPSSRVTDEELDGYLTTAQKDKVNGTTTANGTSTNNSLGRNATNQTTINNSLEKNKLNENNTNNSLGRSNSTETNTNTSLGNNNQTETTELISQGNIGITSSGQLLEDWRKTLINIDMMILNDLNDLFFGLY